MRGYKATAALASLLIGCTAASDSAVWFESTDSAGVAIAYSIVALNDTSGWGVSARPVLDIGVMEGNPTDPFYRISWVSKLSDDRIAVVDAGSQEVQYYSGDGVHIRSVGRAGDGPGEFRMPIGVMGKDPDALTIWDPRARRLSVLTVDGDFAATVPVSLTIFNPNLLGVMQDGALIVLDNDYDRPRQEFSEMRMQVTRHSVDGETVDTVGRWPYWRLGPLSGVTTDGTRTVGPPHFEPRGSAAAGPGVIWVGLARQAKVDAFDPVGQLVRSVRWNAPDLTVPSGAAEILLASRLESLPTEQHAVLRTQHEAAPVADHFPVYSIVMTGRDGLLRVQEYPRPDDSGSSRWLLFDERGAIRGRLLLPRTFRPMEWGEDYVTGVFRDELDVEIVRVYELEWE